MFSKRYTCLWKRCDASLRTRGPEHNVLTIIMYFTCWIVVVFNPLSPSDAKLKYRARSTLAYAIAWCLKAPRHYLTECQLIIRDVKWQLPGDKQYHKIYQYLHHLNNYFHVLTHTCLLSHVWYLLSLVKRIWIPILYPYTSRWRLEICHQFNMRSYKYYEWIYTKSHSLWNITWNIRLRINYLTNLTLV